MSEPQAPAAALTPEDAAAERFLYDDKELEAFSRNGFCVGARWQYEQDQAEIDALAKRIDAVLRDVAERDERLLRWEQWYRAELNCPAHRFASEPPDAEPHKLLAWNSEAGKHLPVDEPRVRVTDAPMEKCTFIGLDGLHYSDDDR